MSSHVDIIPSFTGKIHYHLTKAEGIPVVGVCMVSPVKVVVSLVQAVASLALAIIFGVLAALTNNKWLTEKYGELIGQVTMGVGSLIGSAVNILTLGVSGYRLRKEMIEADVLLNRMQIFSNMAQMYDRMLNGTPASNPALVPN